MARPERPLDPSDGPIAAFAMELRKLRVEAGSPKYLQMARRTGRSRTALAEAAGGDHLPTWETVEAFVAACGAEPAAWLSRWEQAREGVRPGTPVARPVEEPSPPGTGSVRRPTVALVAAGLAAGLVIGVLGTAALLRRPTEGEARIALPGRADQPAAVGFTAFASFVDADLATAGVGGDVVIWNSKNRRKLRTIGTGDTRVTALAFDPQDRNYLATAGPNGVVRLWDVSTGAKVQSLLFQEPGGPVVLRFDPVLRGELAIGGARGVVKIWRTQQPGQPPLELHTGLSRVTALSYDPHSATTLAVGGPQRAEVWNTATGRKVPGIRPMPGPVSALAFDPMTQNTLAIAVPGASLGIWDASNGKFVRPMRGSRDVTAVGFNPQIGNSLLSGDGKGRLQVWDASNGLPVHRVGTTAAAVSSLAYAADGRALASGDRHGHVELWRIEDW